MRQRKNNNLSFNDEESGSDDDHSDPEDSIQAVPPEDEKPTQMSPLRKQNHQQQEAGIDANGTTNLLRARWKMQTLLEELRTNKVWWAQCSTIMGSALLTYSYHNAGLSATNVQMAIMTVITLVGASPFCSTHLTTAAIGTFVGGQNIIGATQSSADHDPFAVEFRFTNYLWLLCLGGCVGLVWCFGITHPRIKLLDGYAGRLGTTTFIGMNAVMVCLWGPLGVVDWARYYYGLRHVVHVAEEDDLAAASLASAWSWTEEVELAVGYVLSVLWIGVAGGATRILHHRSVQRWHRHQREALAAREGGFETALPQTPKEPAPLNNVLVPVLWALFSNLVVNATGYRHSYGLYNGFAVGAYVAMASLQKIPTVAAFATVSLVAALWGLALTPLFVGFAGKSGFTSMMGHVTHEALVKILKRARTRLLRQQRMLDEEERQRQQRLREEEEERLQQREREEERRRLQEEQAAAEEEAKRSGSVHEPYHPPAKPSRQKKKELVFSTKQQRRQQQRILQQQRQQQKQRQEQQPKFPQEQTHEPTRPLRHRAWIATPADGDGKWEWDRELQDSSPHLSKNNIV